MKKILAITLLLLILSQGNLTAQNTPLPITSLKALSGDIVSTESFDNDGKPIIISFWATWCKPCILELTTISEEYQDWQEETGVKLIAISIDDARNSAKVPPFVNGKGWEYEVYIDENGDLKRAMNVTDVPHTFILNGNKEKVWEHRGYSPGNEEELIDKVRELSAE